MPCDQLAGERQAIEARVLALLPEHPPGLPSRVVYEHVATWSLGYTSNLLRRLERDGRIQSALVPHERPQIGPRRQFWRRLAAQ